MRQNAADVKLAWLGQSSFHIPPCLISFNLQPPFHEIRLYWKM